MSKSRVWIFPYRNALGVNVDGSVLLFLSIMRIAVAIVNFNSGRDLYRCIKALRSGRLSPSQIVVVDNASSDGSVEYATKDGPEPSVSIIWSPINLGYGSACNLAFRDCDCDVLIAMNPDAFVDPVWLEQIAASFASVKAGAVGGKARRSDGRTLYHAGGWLESPMMQGRHYGYGQEDDGQHNTRRNMPYVVGCAIAISARAFRDVGGFDPRYFLYYEEVDLCFRLQRAGYDVIYEPNATLIHHGGAVTQQGSTTFFSRYHTSRYRFVTQNFDSNFLFDQWLPAERAYALRNLSRRERDGLILAAYNFASQNHEEARSKTLVQRVIRQLKDVAALHETTIEEGTESDVCGWL